MGRFYYLWGFKENEFEFLCTGDLILLEDLSWGGVVIFFFLFNLVGFWKWRNWYSIANQI